MTAPNREALREAMIHRLASAHLQGFSTEEEVDSLLDPDDGEVAALLAAAEELDQLREQVQRVRGLADAIEDDWEAVYAEYEDDDTATLIRAALDGPR